MVSASLDLRFPDEVQDDVYSLCTTLISRVRLLTWFMCLVTQGGGQEGPLACSECHVKLSVLQWRPPHPVSSVVPSSAGGGRSSPCTPLGRWRNVCQVPFSVRVSMLALRLFSF